jgi:hypothetical protein
MRLRGTILRGPAQRDKHGPAALLGLTATGGVGLRPRARPVIGRLSAAARSGIVTRHVVRRRTSTGTGLPRGRSVAFAR